MMPPERAPQGEQNGTIFSFVAPSSADLRALKDSVQHCTAKVKVVTNTSVSADSFVAISVTVQ